jgi:hypothetical protein
MRRVLKEQAQTVADGGNPMCVFRDPENDRAVKLVAHRVDRKITVRLPPNLEPTPFPYSEPLEALETIRQAARTWWKS